MTDGAGPSLDTVIGSNLETGVSIVLDREETVDRTTVESALELVADDGVITRAGVRSALGDAAQYVSTPENRLELTADALAAAQTAADPASELPTVQSRLDEFEGRFKALEGDVTDLVARLDTLVERTRHPDDVYDLAAAIRDLKWDAREVHADAEELRTALEAFERWANDPDVRFRDLDGDVTRVERLLDGIVETVDTLGESAATPDAGNAPDAAVRWVDAVLQHRVVRLLLTDLTAELTDLRAWPDCPATSSQDAEAVSLAERADAIERRIIGLREREERVGDVLDALTRPAWRDRYGDRIGAFESDLDAFTPPIQWGGVQHVLEEHRRALPERPDAL